MKRSNDNRGHDVYFLTSLYPSFIQSLFKLPSGRPRYNLRNGSRRELKEELFSASARSRGTHVWYVVTLMIGVK